MLSCCADEQNRGAMSSSTSLPVFSPGAPAAEERTVLVVDDEEMIQELISGALAGAGYACDRASNGAEALERLADRESAFILTDVRMPMMDGLELLDQVRLHHPDTFVILLTGAAEVPIVVRALRSGASDFLTKPFSIAELLERLHAAADRRTQYLRERHVLRTHDDRLEELTQRYYKGTEGVVEAVGTVLGRRHPATPAQ